MKRILLYLILSVSVACGLIAQTPAWINSRPVSDKEYIGIGMSLLSDTDYLKKATQNALADIASQIAVKLENNSFLHVVDVDGYSREMFEDKIQSSLAAWIEGQELKDTYQSEDKYYVYYVLDKREYVQNLEKRRKQVVQKGLDFLKKGRDAENQMNLVQAVQLYGKGLETVEPWTFMDLMGDGINVPAELYNAYINVFSGMAITTNLNHLEGEAFKAIPTPVAGCLSKGGDVIPNVKLKLTFVLGEGAVSDPVETDYTGTAEFYITNVTSKDKVQELRISIDDSFVNTLPQSYRQLLKDHMWPSAKITLELKSTPLTAFLYVNDEHDLEGIEQRINSLLVNNHFVVTENPDEALLFVELSSKQEIGDVVSGGMYDLNTCYCSLILKIYNNKNEQLLLNYSVDQLKVLSPVHKSVNESITMCIREVMKRVNRELPNRLKKMNVN